MPGAQTGAGEPYRKCIFGDGREGFELAKTFLNMMVDIEEGKFPWSLNEFTNFTQMSVCVCHVEPFIVS